MEEKFKFYNVIEEKEMELPICKSWKRNTDTLGTMRLMIAKSIVISNLILTKLIIKIQDIVGSKTETSLIDLQ